MSKAKTIKVHSSTDADRQLVKEAMTCGFKFRHNEAVIDGNLYVYKPRMNAVENVSPNRTFDWSMLRLQMAEEKTS